MGKYKHLIIGLLAGILITVSVTYLYQPRYSTREECVVKELQKNKTNYTRTASSSGLELNKYEYYVEEYCRKLDYPK